jgi:uncharacterized protein (DUF885 family)
MLDEHRGAVIAGGRLEKSVQKAIWIAVILWGAILAAPASGATAERASPNADQQLRALMAASDEKQLQLNPLQALFRGDMRYAGIFGDYITDEYFAAERRSAIDDLAALQRIDRAALNAGNRISYDAFEFQRKDDLQYLEPDVLTLTIDRPIDHFSGFQTLIPDLSSGDGSAPFKTIADYKDNLLRLNGYIIYLDRAIDRMRHGMATGVVNPKLVMRNVVSQLDALLAEGVEGSTFYKPVKKFPASIVAKQRARLTLAYADFIRNKLIPAHTRLRDFINDKYLPQARDSVGLGQMPGGNSLYRLLAASSTTTDMTPEAIHALGLSEVGRIHREMQLAKARCGFAGGLAEFQSFLRSDPRFAPASPQAMRGAFLAIDAKVSASIPRDFSLTPRSKLVIRPVPSYKEKSEAGGSYQSGTPDGARPGIFYYNTYDLPTRFTWEFETLFLHEGIPGHHFQISLAQENTGLPKAQRFSGNTAYSEGWALYAESLGEELGMFGDPYQLYGHLDDEMLRAMRLVVDTGIHNEGWTRDAAITYMLENSAMSRNDVTAEVERYIAIPGQALAYKIGQLTIRRLRAKSEAAFGSKFNVRDFHAQILDSGALPMAVLERKIDDWISFAGLTAHAAK